MYVFQLVILGKIIMRGVVESAWDALLLSTIICTKLIC